MLIFVRASEVLTYGNGIVGLEIQSRPLEADELKFLKTMFPNTLEQAENLLSREALLTAIDDLPDLDKLTVTRHDTGQRSRLPENGPVYGKKVSPPKQ